VHPFYPNWYCADAVFIFEPWLWVVLGVAAALNTRRRPSLLIVLLLVLTERAGLDFTRMLLSPERDASRCPPNLTHWSPPRADLLSG